MEYFDESALQGIPQKEFLQDTAANAREIARLHFLRGQSGFAAAFGAAATAYVALQPQRPWAALALAAVFTLVNGSICGIISMTHRDLMKKRHAYNAEEMRRVNAAIEKLKKPAPDA